MIARLEGGRIAPQASSIVTPLLQLQCLVVLAIAVGGGGVAYGLHNLVVQLAALVILAANGERVLRFAGQGPWFLRALLIATLLFPLLQLIPLPPVLWQGLPGRSLMVESRALAGIDAQAWAPLSLDAGRTLVAFCGMLAAACMIAIGSTLPSDQRLRLAATCIGAALPALLFGSVQLASANTTGMIFPITPNPDVLYTTFANRNSGGLLFVLALVLLVALPFVPSRGWLLARAGAGSLLALGTVLTQSRSAMALLALALLFGLLRMVIGLLGQRAVPVSGKAFAIGAIGLTGLALSGLLTFSVMDGGRAAASLQRFETIETDRLEMWEDSVFAAREYWPAGSGMGTFDEVFQVHESLEYVSPRKAGRAHNDFLEIAIEGGVAALLLAAAWLAWIVFAALRGTTAAERWLRLGGGLGLGCIAMQSAIDYPLRNQAILCVAAVLVVLLCPPGKPAR